MNCRIEYISKCIDNGSQSFSLLEKGVMKRKEIRMDSIVLNFSCRYQYLFVTCLCKEKYRYLYGCVCVYMCLYVCRSSAKRT